MQSPSGPKVYPKSCSAFGRCVDKTFEQGGGRGEEAELNLVQIAFDLLRLCRGDPSLTKLDVSFCSIPQLDSLLPSTDSDSDSESGDSDAKEAETPPTQKCGRMKVLADAISASRVLIELKMVNCDVGPRGCAVLCAGIGRSAALRTLNLSHNRLGAEGARCLAMALAESRSLEALILKACNIGPHECAALSPGICKNASLVKLDLSFTRTEEEGAIILGQAVRNGLKRRVPLELVGVELACIAERIGLDGISNKGAATAILAALDDISSTGVEVSRDD